MKTNVKRVCLLCIVLPAFFSCASYRTKLTGYYNSLGQSDYREADKQLSANNFLQHERNKLLYYMEKGKLYHLMGSYDSSNLYFNLADNFIDMRKKSGKDVLVGNLLNPMMQTYLGEDHERFLLHYYKALNYLYKGSMDEAVVEARRITLSTYSQQQKFRPNAKRYTEDAFALMVQGMIYEAAGDINNAFISYRNAADLYLDAPDRTYYGVRLPEQLKSDVLRTADLLGFTEEVDVYQRKLNRSFEKKAACDGGELIVFFEKGMAPVKTEQNYILTQNGNGSSDFIFTNEFGTFNIPFDYTYANRSRSDVSLDKFRTVRVAIPSYAPRGYNTNLGVAIVGGKRRSSEMAEDINTLAPAILKERMVKEVSSALVRQVVKKLTEAGASAAAKETSKNNSKEKDEAKKESKAQTASLITGLVVNMFNTATEKADTRNWQSLPAYIEYVRVPLQKGENAVTLQMGNQVKTVSVEGTGRLKMYNWIVSR